MDTSEGEVVAPAGPEEGGYVDALPYLDGAPSGAFAAAVEAEVAREMRRMGTPPGAPEPYEPFQDKPLLRKAYERASKGLPSAPLDTSRHQLRPPAQADLAPASAWRSSVSDAEAQVAHQGARLLHLELLSTYGASAWALHNEGLRSDLERVEAEAAREREACVEVNQGRKRAQVGHAGELQRLESEWWNLVQNNVLTDAANKGLEAQVQQLKETAQERGLILQQE